jgi:uncharacterized protein (TIGR02145 family)
MNNIKKNQNKNMRIAFMKNRIFLTAMAVLAITIISKAQKTGTFTDKRDGKTYKTVTIGTQTMLAENFAYKPETGNYWAYRNDPNNVSKYGYFYDWQTAKAVVPIGWHLPTKDEWKLLTDYLEGQDNSDEMGYEKAYRATIEGGSSGFNCVLVGDCTNSGGFIGFGSFTSFWSSTDDGPEHAWIFFFSYDAEEEYDIVSASIIFNPIDRGLSVRLFKD